MAPIRRFAVALTLIGVLALPVAGAQASSNATKPPPLATHPLKVTNPGVVERDGFPVINVGRLPAGACPLGQSPSSDPSCVVVPIDVTNVSDRVINLVGINFNTYGFGPFSVEGWSGVCAVLQPGDSCQQNMFVHVLGLGPAWTYVGFADDSAFFLWVRLQWEGV